MSIRGMPVLSALLAVVLGAAVAAAAGEDEEARQVLRRVQRSVVTLRNAEGASVAVVLRADGLLLTGSFVVSSPAPFHALVDTGVAGARPVAFRKVDVVGFHPQLDLALVRIDPREQKVALTPAVVSRAKGAPGQGVVAIGAPDDPAGARGLAAAGGLLSGVDREMGGAKYYQIDAPVTPGHAGGPLVDRAGQVLGIVAFAFSELEAVSFAIPLHDLDVSRFVPAAERKADSDRARELLAAAERFARSADVSQRVEGRRGENWVLASAYATLAYRMALAAAPGEPRIYGNVGMLLRSLDQDPAAVPYLMRAIQLMPWDGDGGQAYRELGLALAKQGRLDQARSAWREGVAKQPYAARIWEDLAILHMMRRELPEAMNAASVALYIPERETRVTLLNDIREFVRAATPPASRGDIEARASVDAVRGELARMVTSSNRARAERQLYMTGPFRDLVRILGGPPVAGVERRIPQEPLVGLDR
jgi:S1-C subfamily serine protease